MTVNYDDLRAKALAASRTRGRNRPRSGEAMTDATGLVERLRAMERGLLAQARPTEGSERYMAEVAHEAAAVIERQAQAGLREAVEAWAESLDNAYHATLIPMPVHLHARALTEVVETMRDEMIAALAAPLSEGKT